MTKKGITYFWTFPHNFGNYFIDFGSIQSLKEAAPDYTINQVGGLSRILFEERYYYGDKKKILKWFQTNIIKSILGEKASNNIKSKICSQNLDIDEIDFNKIYKNFLDIGLYINSDFAVISGCILDKYIIQSFGSTLLNLKEKGIKIIINGGGGSTYDKKMILKIRNLLNKIKPYAFISRDEMAFKNYQDLAQYSHDGIDCGFFVNDYFTPAKLEIPPYNVFTFDSQPDPKIDLNDNNLVVRTSHSPFWDIPKKCFDKPNTVFTNLAEDYLNLYANAEAVYTDRVHACVAALSYGTPCRLYNETPRAQLFEKVGGEEIGKRLIHPDTNKIENEKSRQIKFLSDVLEG